MSNKNTLRAVIHARQAGKSFPAVEFVKTQPELAALLSKLVQSDVRPTHDQYGNRDISVVDQNNFANVSKEIAQKGTDSDTIMQLFPEMELSAQILISSIISPKDMNTTEVAFSLPDTLKVSPLAAQLLAAIEEHFTKVYKIEPLLPEILRQTLFGDGSYPMLVIPENSVDDLINGQRVISTESLNEYLDSNLTFKPIGILGPVERSTKTKDNLSLEALVAEGYYKNNVTESVDNRIYFADGNTKIALEHLVVVDNFNTLKLPRIIDRKRSQVVNEIIVGQSRYQQASFESIKMSSKLTDVNLSNLLYKNRGPGYRTVVKAKTDSEVARSTVGAPLTMKLPAESVIPVFTPGDVRKHVGYFVLIDGEGNPVSRTAQQSQFDSIRSRMGSDQMSSSLLNQAAKINGVDCKQVTFDQAARVYAEIVEADLLARLRNGIVGQGVKIAENNEVYKIMLARTLKKQNTQLLYVPGDLMTYFANKYDDRGIGKSLLDDMRILNSLRAMLLFSQVMASTKNSIGRTKVKIKLSDVDPNPQKTIEVAMHEVAKLRNQSFPIGTNTVGDLVHYVQNSGLEYEYEGHPGLPDTAVEFSEHQTNYAKPDTELEEMLRKRSIMSTGLSPETVDNGFSAEFATTVVANSLLLSKRVTQIQESFVPQITDHCRKEAINNGSVIKEIKQIIKENLKKITEVSNPDEEVSSLAGTENEELLVHLLAMEFLSNFDVRLSQPDSITLQNQMEAFDKQSEAYDKGLNFFISSEILPSSMAGEEASQRVDEVKAIIKANLMRRWMAQNHVLPELSEIIATNDDGSPMINFMEEQSEHTNALTRSLVKLLEGVVPVGQAGDRDVQNITGGEDLGESTASEPSNSDSGGDDTGGDSDGMDDVGGTDELGGDPTDETNTGDDTGDAGGPPSFSGF